MSDNTGTPYEIYKQEYIEVQGEHFSKLVLEQKFSQALLHYQNNQKWLEMFGPKTLQLLSDTYKGLGLYDASNQYMQAYVNAEKAKDSDGGRHIASLLKPSQTDNDFAQGKYKEVISALPPKPETVEEIHMAMVSHFRLGQMKDAYRLADILKDYAGELGEVAIVDVTEVLTARAFENKDFSEMETILSKARKGLGGANERVEFLYADSLWYQQKHAQAVSAYTETLEKFPKSDRADRSKYNLALSLVETGKRKEGVKLLTDLQEKGQNLWSASAKQELELLNWESKYSTILRGLPPSGLGVVR
jgi:tetratricopeptide (TPR) repeat protein